MILTITKHWRNLAKRFVSFFFLGIAVLLAEIVFTGFLIYQFHIDHILAIGIGFFTSLCLSYFLFRKYTFYGTKRSHLGGFIYFSIIAIGGLTISMGGSYLLISLTGMHPLLARFLIASISGLFNFLVNTIYNFKVAHFS